MAESTYSEHAYKLWVKRLADADVEVERYEAKLSRVLGRLLAARKRARTYRRKLAEAEELVATGAAAATLQIPPWVYLGLAVAYEAIELAHEYPSGSWIFGSKAHEWDVNVLTDLASGFLGYALVAWHRGDQANHP